MNIFEALRLVHAHQITVSRSLRQFGRRVDDIHEMTSDGDLSVAGKRFRDGMERDGLQALEVLETPIADHVRDAREVMRDAGLDWTAASTYVAILCQLRNEQYVLSTLSDDDRAKARYERMVARTASRLPAALV